MCLTVSGRSLRDLATGVFDDKTAADEPTRVAAECGQLGAADYTEGDPIVLARETLSALRGSEVVHGV